MNPERALDEATRIAAGATRSRYDGVAIALHWLTVFLVLSLFALGELWGFAQRPLRHELVTLHMSLGILLGLAVAARIAWRLMPGHKVTPAGTGLADRLAASRPLAALCFARHPVPVRLVRALVRRRGDELLRPAHALAADAGFAPDPPHAPGMARLGRLGDRHPRSGPRRRGFLPPFRASQFGARPHAAARGEGLIVSRRTAPAPSPGRRSRPRSSPPSWRSKAG